MVYIETRTALKDKQKIKSMTGSTKKRLKDLVDSIIDNPRDLDAIGKPEQLKYSDIELWSRELTKKDRIVYAVEPGHLYEMNNENEIIVFYQYLGHYTDK